MKAYESLGWGAGLSFWEYYDDMEGTAIEKAIGNLVKIFT